MESKNARLVNLFVKMLGSCIFLWSIALLLLKQNLFNNLIVVSFIAAQCVVNLVFYNRKPNPLMWPLVFAPVVAIYCIDVPREIRLYSSILGLAIGFGFTLWFYRRKESSKQLK